MTNSKIHIIDIANASYLDRQKPPSPIDATTYCTIPNTKFYENLKDAGVDTVIRYYSDRNNAGINCKNITKRERDMLHDFGFAIGIVYQYNGRARGRYKPSRAKKDADFALIRASVIEQPEGSCIYFGVDADADKNSVSDVLGYFQVVKEVFDGRYDVGVYAAGSRCKALKDEGLAKYFWIPEAPAWDGTNQFMNSEDWTFYQNKTNIQNSALARNMGQEIKLDTDFINPKAGNTIGAFNKDGSIKTYSSEKIEKVGSARFWVKSKRAKLFDRPNGTYNGRYMCIARMVHVLEEVDGWVKVDVDEDGIAEGYCKMSDLSPLEQMPWWTSGCRPQAL